MAILRILNPTACTDIFYGLSSNGDISCFEVKAWKGRVRKNSHLDLIINCNLAQDGNSPQRETSLSISQLYGTKFFLQMNEYTSKWRNSNRDSQNLVVKIELQCVTREILLKVEDESKLKLDDLSLTFDAFQQYLDKHLGRQELEMQVEQSPFQFEPKLHEEGDKEQLTSKLTEDLVQEQCSSDVHTDMMQNVPTMPTPPSSTEANNCSSMTTILLMFFAFFLALLTRFFFDSICHCKQFVSEVASRFVSQKQGSVKPPEKERDKGSN